jgi:hypothetical protein
VSDPPPAKGPAPAGRRRLGEVIAGWSRATKSVVEGLVAVLTLLALLGVYNATKGDETKGEPMPTPTPTRADVRVDPSAIRVRAGAPSLGRQDDDRGANDYSPDNLLDGNVRTAWVEGVPGLAEGSRLRFTLPERVELTRIRIVNGYAKNTAHLLDNAAARSIEIRTDGTDRPLKRELAHSARPQTIRGAFGTTQEVVVRILSGYEGQRFEDLAVSEISFFAKPT